MKLSEQELSARDAKRDIAAELLEAVREMKAGKWARKTTFEIMPDGTILRRIEAADGKLEKEEKLTGARWELMAARTRSGLSQADFARAMGVSKRTLENWEQERVEPARRLLKLAAIFPDTLQRLSSI